MSHPLYVVTCISNPVRYQSRYDLYHRFAEQMRRDGAILYTTEMAFGDRPHEVTQADNPRHIQLRSTHELWHKEQMLNIAISRLPSDAKYVAWIDADVMFHRHDWIEETIHQLQHYKFVQLFSHATDLSPMFQPMKTHTSFVHDWYHGTPKDEHGYMKPGHPGYAWAGTMEALHACGGLLDHAILGSADRHMADAFLGRVHKGYHKNIHKNYKKLCEQWQKRAMHHVNGNIGYVSGTISHYWHGSKQNRHYNDRWKILVEHQFDPLTDIWRDTQGLWQLTHEKPGLRDAIRKYFRSRAEDCIYTGEYKLIS